MIRFLPDTFRDAIWRPLAMASPEGGVYVEIIAPDFRFAFALVLALGWLLLARGTKRRVSPPVILLAITALAFVPWLATTGNGRYFIAFLLITGPLCIGLVRLIPATRSLHLVLAAGMVLWQAYLVHEVNPWRTWTRTSWSQGPAFQLEVPPEIAALPATYVTVASISYSVIAPRFHPDSRWINISTLQGLIDKSPDSLRAQELIAAPGPLKLIFPTVPGGHEQETIYPALGKAIDDLLARQGLSIEDESQCRILASPSLTRMAAKRQDSAHENAAIHGFWLCPLVRHASPRATRAGPVAQATESAFARVESLCPRLFKPGDAVSLRIPGGAVRGYPGSDFKLYVFDDGQVWYKYYRALNPVLLGKAETIMGSAFSMDCDKILGRSGLPWERGI
jgi:hypothetical protein